MKHLCYQMSTKYASFSSSFAKVNATRLCRLQTVQPIATICDHIQRIYESPHCSVILTQMRFQLYRYEQHSRYPIKFLSNESFV